jgi:adenylate cyclase
MPFSSGEKTGNIWMRPCPGLDAALPPRPASVSLAARMKVPAASPQSPERAGAPAASQETSLPAGLQLFARITSASAQLNASRERILAVLRDQVRAPVDEMLRCADALAKQHGMASSGEMKRFQEAARHLLLILETTTAVDPGASSGNSVGQKSGGLPVVPGAGDALGKGSVLIVDDNAESCGLLSQLLEIEGYVVGVAGTGEAALEQMGAGNFDLVLLDLFLPGINGFEVLERLRRNPALRHIPVIMLSGDDQHDSIIRGIEMGAEDFLQKPFNPVLLRARIESSMQKKRFRDQEQAILEQLRIEQEKSEALLLNILPKPVADRLKQGQSVIVDSFPEVTVLFADLADFTTQAARHSPAEVVRWLNLIFSEFDRLAEVHGLEKIKTIGDSYMAVSGVPTPRADHAPAAAEMALAMQAAITRLNHEHETLWRLRIGLHTGPVIAGIIGTKKFTYDLWGDTVNTASRMESHGSPGQIQVSEETYQKLRQRFHLTRRGVIDVKGKGMMTTYLLQGREHA